MMISGTYMECCVPFISQLLRCACAKNIELYISSTSSTCTCMCHSYPQAINYRCSPVWDLCGIFEYSLMASIYFLLWIHNFVYAY